MEEYLGGWTDKKHNPACSNKTGARRGGATREAFSRAAAAFL